jgi:fibronectin type 3 domain-containing protein
MTGFLIFPALFGLIAEGANIDDDSRLRMALAVGDFFTQNLGQIPASEVQIYSENAHFTSTGVFFRVIDGAISRSTHDSFSEHENGMFDVDNAKMHVFAMKFVGAGEVVPIGIDELPYRCNFFYGNDPQKWISGVPNYRSICYRDLYPGIDLAYRIVPEGLKYEYVVNPGADLDDIRVGYEGADISTDGKSVTISTPLGEFVDGGLYCYQRIDGRTISADIQIVVDNNVVSFRGDYDPNYALVIDPLIYSTFLGGYIYDIIGELNSVAVDPMNNMYVSGTTTSPDFPHTPGAFCETIGASYDTFVTKLAADGKSLVFSTYIGGNKLETTDCLDIDVSNNIIVGGRTSSDDFPTTVNAFQTNRSGMADAFLLKLNKTGSSLSFSTLLGGESDETIFALKINDAGNIYCSGLTNSTYYPITAGSLNLSAPGTYDIFVSEVDANGSNLLASAVFGGSGDDFAYSICFDNMSNICLTGKTLSSDFPTTANAYSSTYGGDYDIFIIKLDEKFTKLIYSSYIGKAGSEIGYSIGVLNQSNAIVIAGVTSSLAFPVTFGAYDTVMNGSSDSFVLVLNASGTSIDAATYVGGKSSDEIISTRIDFSGMIYATGVTQSTDFPTTWGENNSAQGVFLIKLNSKCDKLIFSSLIGRGHSTSLALDSSNDVYIGGDTSYSTFPTTPGAYDTSYNQGGDVFALKFKLPVEPSPPRNLAGATGDETVSLSWDTPAKDGQKPVTNYRVYRGFSENQLPVASLVGNVTDFTDPNVRNGITYYYAVAAINAMGEGNRSAVINVTPGVAPTPPTSLKAQTGDHFINLSWQPPADMKGFPVTNYSVSKGSRSDSLTVLARLGNVTGYNDSSVQNGLVYYYGVTATNARGESLFGYINASPGKAPSPPENLRAVASVGRVGLTWEAPLDDGGFEVERYGVYRTVGEETVKLTETPATSYDDDYVENGLVHYYSVSAVNSRGEGPRCDPVQAIPGNLPGAPTLKAAARDGLVELTWLLSDDGGIANPTFNIYKKAPGAADYQLAGSTGQYSYMDYLVLNNETYHYRVAAKNIKGEGSRSRDESATPTGWGRRPAAPTMLNVTGGDGFVKLSWVPPLDTGGLPLTGYAIYRGDASPGIILLMNVNGTFFNDSRVVNGVAYHYSVASINSYGESLRTPEVNVTPNGTGRLPGPPTGLKWERLGKAVRLSWMPPLDLGGRATVSYIVYKDANGTEMVQKANVSEMEYFDLELIFGRSINYRVSAVNALGEGLRSDPVSVLTYDPPGRILNLTTLEGDNWAVMSWQPPLSDGGSRITGYRVFKESANGTKTNWTVAGLSVNDTGVINGVDYTYKVSAINSIGEGEASGPVPVRPGAPPSQPLNLTASVQAESIVLEWRAPRNLGGYKDLEYRVYRWKEGSAKELLASTRALTFEDTNVTKGVGYFYQVSAVNSKGEGFPSDSLLANVKKETPAGKGADIVLNVSIAVVVSLICLVGIAVYRKRRIQK